MKFPLFLSLASQTSNSIRESGMFRHRTQPRTDYFDGLGIWPTTDLSCLFTSLSLNNAYYVMVFPLERCAVSQPARFPEILICYIGKGLAPTQELWPMEWLFPAWVEGVTLVRMMGLAIQSPILSLMIPWLPINFHFFSRIGRHSKSLDTQRFVCALCTGQLVLLTPSNSRGPTPFATFVKENYGTVRQELAGQSHAEVMRKLSADFASKARLSQSWSAYAVDQTLQQEFGFCLH